MPREIRIGEAVIGFRADVGGFISGITGADKALRRKRMAIGRLRRDLSRFGRSVDSVTRNVTSLRSAVGLLAGSAGLGLMARRSAELGSELAELSRRTGVTVEALQTLGRVFSSDGIDTRTFTLLVERMTRAIGGARQGLASFTRGFELLNIDVSTIRDAEDAFLRIADALASGATDRPTAFLALQQLLNRDGRRAFNVLVQGSASIREQQRAFEALGVLTTDQANRLKGLGQVYTDFGTALSTQTARMTSELAGLLGGVLQSVIQQLPRAFDELTRAIRFLIENGEALIHVFGVLFALSLRNTGIVRLAGSFLRAAGAVFSLGNAVESVSANFTRIHTAPTRFFTSLQAGVSRSVAGFAALGRVVSVSFARLLSGLAAARSGTTALTAAATALGTAGRASWAVLASGAAVGVTAVRAVLSPLVAVAGVLRRIVWPIAIIEGILGTITFVRELDTELRSTSLSLTQGLVIAVTKGFFAVIEFLGKIPDFMAGVLMAAGAAARVFFGDLVESAKPFVRGVVDFVQSVLQAVLRGLNRLPDLVSRSLGALITGVGAAASALGAKIGNAVGKGVLDGLLFLTSGIKDLFSSLLPDSFISSLEQFERFATGARNRIAQAQAAAPGVLEDALRSARAAFGSQALQPLIDDTKLFQRRIIETAANVPPITTRETLLRTFEEFKRVFSETSINSIVDGDELSSRVLKAFGFTEEQIREGGDAANRALATTIEKAKRQIALFTGEGGQALPELTFPTPSELNLPAIAGGATAAAVAEETAEAAEELIPEDAARRNAFEVNRIYDTLASDLGRSFGEFARDAVLSFDSIRDAALDLGRAITNALAQALIVAPIQNAIVGALSGGGGVFGSVPALQGGGVGRGLTLVGEGGPELVDFRAPGRVYTNPELQRAISGIENPPQAPTINLTVNSENPGAVRSEILRALPAISDAVSGALAQQVQRRSSERLVFRGS